MAQKNTMLTIDNIISNHLSLRNIVGFLDRETALRVSKLWARVKTQQIASVRFREGASGFGIERVTLRYTGIERITINEKLWRHIDDEDIEVIANNCRQLKKIDIAGCGQITSVSALARKCPELKYIKMRGCHQITDDSLKAIANNCPELTHFDVSYCQNITDVGVISVVTKCPNLTNIELTECREITNNTILAIGERSHNLAIISYYGCGLITEAAEEKMIAQCKMLQFNYLCRDSIHKKLGQMNKERQKAARGRSKIIAKAAHRRRLVE